MFSCCEFTKVILLSKTSVECIRAFCYTNNIHYLYYLLVLKVFVTKIDFFRAGGEKFDLLKVELKPKKGNVKEFK